MYSAICWWILSWIALTVFFCCPCLWFKFGNFITLWYMININKIRYEMKMRAQEDRMRALGLLEPMSALALGTAYNRFFPLTNRLFTSLCLSHRFYFQRCLSRGCWYFFNQLYVAINPFCNFFCNFIFNLLILKPKFVCWYPWSTPEMFTALN